MQQDTEWIQEACNSNLLGHYRAFEEELNVLWESLTILFNVFGSRWTEDVLEILVICEIYPEKKKLLPGSNHHIFWNKIKEKKTMADIATQM